jgi:1-acyl-sn-glycerol-3-phosphate acyltransferase
MYFSQWNYIETYNYLYFLNSEKSKVNFLSLLKKILLKTHVAFFMRVNVGEKSTDKFKPSLYVSKT